VHDDELGAVERRVEIERRFVVQLGPQRRIRGAPGLERRGSAIRGELAGAPRVVRLERAHDVAAVRQRADETAKEMRVAVAPVRAPGVGEEGYTHEAAPARTAYGAPDASCR
jgi:hypothetical protein